MLEAQDEFGATPLFWAVENNNAESVEYLISSGADPTVFNGRGEAPIHVSIRTHNTKVLRTLIKHRVSIHLEYIDSEGVWQLFPISSVLKRYM